MPSVWDILGCSTGHFAALCTEDDGDTVGVALVLLLVLSIWLPWVSKKFMSIPESRAGPGVMGLDSSG